MKISQIDIYAYPLPVRNGPYTMAGSEIRSVDTTLIRIICDNGIVGWGETCPLGPTYQPQHADGARAALMEMAPGLLGADVMQPLLFRRRMDALLNGHAYAKAALDIAIHDAMGKQLGMRVADLLGGVVTEQVPSYYATGIGEPDEVARIAEEKVGEGYHRLQLKVGGRDVVADIAVARKVWERVGGRAALALDANRGLLARDVIRLSRECQDIPFVLEQPCDSLDEIRSIRHQINHPIYIDEGADSLATVTGLIAEGICDGFGMKLTRIGGIQMMVTFRNICEARSIPHTCDDTWGGDIIAAACVHVGATVSPKLLEGVWIAQPYIDGHYDDTNGIVVSDGHIALPSGPGLGVEPNEEQFGSPLASF